MAFLKFTDPVMVCGTESLILLISPINFDQGQHSGSKYHKSRLQVIPNFKNLAIAVVGTFFLYLVYLLWGAGPPRMPEMLVDLHELINYRSPNPPPWPPPLHPRHLLQHPGGGAGRHRRRPHSQGEAVHQDQGLAPPRCSAWTMSFGGHCREDAGGAGRVCDEGGPHFESPHSGNPLQATRHQSWPASSQSCPTLHGPCLCEVISEEKERVDEGTADKYSQNNYDLWLASQAVLKG